MWSDEDRRARVAALDGLFMHLYSLDESDAGYILETFPIVREQDTAAFGRYRTKDDVLAQLRCIASGKLALSDSPQLAQHEGKQQEGLVRDRI